MGRDSCVKQVSRRHPGASVRDGDFLACRRASFGIMFPCCCRTRRILKKYTGSTGTRELCYQHMLMRSIIPRVESFAIWSEILRARELQTVGEVVERQRGNVQSVAIGGKTDRMYSRSDYASRMDEETGLQDKRLLYNTDTLVYLLCFVWAFLCYGRGPSISDSSG